MMKWLDFLNVKLLESKKLWCSIRIEVKNVERKGKASVLNDLIQERSYENKNKIMYWHYFNVKNMHVKGFNLLFYILQYVNVFLSIRCKIFYKNVIYLKIKIKRVKENFLLEK